MAADVIDLIMHDHREVERMFDQLRHQPETRPLVAPVLTALLTAHSRAEEAEVYPAAKDEADESDEISHSQREHAQAEYLLEQLGQADPESAKFDRVLEELIESVDQHVEEEESTVLPRMRERLDERRRRELGRAFAASRARHLGDHPGEATREELRIQARNAGLTGASNMDKEELTAQLRSME